jgi:hypothetical protein
MKTSIAIVFAAAALMLSATVATAHFESYSGKSPGTCGVSPCPFKANAPIPLPGPGPYRGL